jgi:para-aminobenzoate synthetase/4-amino-4-deoxychorismate lyase
MQLINALERGPRGVYTGTIGYCAPGDRACFNVAIRTVRIRGHQGEVGVGSGIVYDSRPAEEYREVLLKARFLTGCGERFSLLETMLYKDGYYLLNLHLARLAASCRYFAVPYNEQAVRKELGRFSRTLAGPAKVRLEVDLSGGLRLESGPFRAAPSRIRVMLDCVPVSAENVFLYHKTTNRAWYQERLRRARRAGFYEVLFRNKRGELTEGAFTNLFVAKNNRMYTPPVSCGLLPGVLRQDLLDRGRALEKKLFLRDLRQADKVYIGNSVRGLCAAEIFLADS